MIIKTLEIAITILIVLSTIVMSVGIVFLFVALLKIWKELINDF